jgi:hypothetical protein
MIFILWELALNMEKLSIYHEHLPEAKLESKAFVQITPFRIINHPNKVEENTATNGRKELESKKWWAMI